VTERRERAWVIAHRGASRDCPENSPAAFDEALRQGADGIELDVQLSRDGIPVVYHDRTLMRAGGGRRGVARLDYAELRRLDPGNGVDGRFRGQHICSLEQILKRYGRRTRLLVEIKTREGRTGAERHILLARTVAGLIERMQLGRKVYLLSFDTDVLRAVAEAAPRIRRVLNLRPPRRISRRLRELLPRLSALSADVRTLTPSFGTAVRAAGLPLFCYTCNTAERVERALRAGVRAVMSDRPAWLAEQLERRHEAG
jgi:glycerophosphoryl diester phosphodiesterase